MTDQEVTEKKSKKSRVGIVLTIGMMLLLLGAGLYGASWWNARSFYLIVDATEVRIGQGRMLPVGHRPFLPKDRELEAAYRSFVLPGGMQLSRGTTRFHDRVELDQAIYRILNDAVKITLSDGRPQRATRASKYLEQMKALPGTNATQQAELLEIAGQVRLIDGLEHVEQAVGALKRAQALLQEGESKDSTREAWIKRIEDALSMLKDTDASPPKEKQFKDVKTSTVAVPQK